MNRCRCCWLFPVGACPVCSTPPMASADAATATLSATVCTIYRGPRCSSCGAEIARRNVRICDACADACWREDG